MSEDKLKKIKEIIQQVYFLTSDEIVEYLEAVKNFPDEGQEKFLKMLEEAKAKQNEILIKLTTKNPDYAKDLKSFVTKTANSLKNQFETEEKEKAENILKDL
jgi:hypothetical protein